MHFVINAINTSGKDLFKTLKDKGYQIPSNNILTFETTKLTYNYSVPENIIDDEIATFWASNEYYPSVTINFGNNKFLLTCFSIFGINIPYLTAFNISGSYNGNEWELIDEYTNLGKKLQDKNESFHIDKLNQLYNSIRIQCISSEYEDESQTNHSCGIRELKIYGVFMSYHYFLYTTILYNKIHYQVLINSFLLYFID